MIKLNKNLFLIVALAGGSIGFTACSSAPTNTANSNTTVVANTNTTKTTTETKTETKTETAAADKIGVPECDDFLTKYEACVTTKVPESARASFKTGMEQWRSSWKQLAANPQTKGTLVDVCKKSLESSKQSLSAYSCAW
jgi:hypothetical protein